MKVRAIYKGGAFLPVEPPQGLASGEAVTLEVKRGRSLGQHNLLFHAIKRAFDNWPEDHPFQPQDETQLRYWLEIEAGWGDCITFHNPREALKFIQNHWKDNMWTEVYSDVYTVYIAKSIKYNRMERGDFTKLMDNMDQVLMNSMGVGLLELKESAVVDVQ